MGATASCCCAEPQMPPAKDASDHHSVQIDGTVAKKSRTTLNKSVSILSNVRSQQNKVLVLMAGQASEKASTLRRGGQTHNSAYSHKRKGLEEMVMLVEDIIERSQGDD